MQLTQQTEHCIDPYEWEDFFNDAVIAGRIVEVLNDLLAQDSLRLPARADRVVNFSLRQALAGYEGLLGIAPSDPVKAIIESNIFRRQQNPLILHPKHTLIGGQPQWTQIA